MKKPPEAQLHGEAWTYYCQWARSHVMLTDEESLRAWAMFLEGWKAKGKQNGLHGRR
jgi:hypothetical protein